MRPVIHERPAETTPGAKSGQGYRPHLDGLRAIAVYLVVLFHAGVAFFAGGFIGVDVFFVLSGYLVTQLLMRDLDARGTVRFGRFYARRMRRLLPASAVLLIVTAIVYSAISSPADVVNVVGSFKAAFLYVANWYFIGQSADYFAADINTNPVIHFWSLAIEEQFYLVWPVLLGGLYVATRRWREKAHRAMQGAVVVAGLLSLGWALSLAHTNVTRAYYGTDTRAYQLLAGALLALSPGVIRRASRFRWVKAAAAAALVALVVVATSEVALLEVHRGVAATMVAFGLIVAIEAARGGPVNRFLSSGAAVYLGKISYGTYLWHWPVILVALNLTDDQISPLSLFGVSALVATGLASLSYTILERPIREQRLLDRLNPAVIVIGLTISIVSALVVIPYILDPYRSSAATVQTTESGFPPKPPLDFHGAEIDIAGVRTGTLPNVGPDLDGVHFNKAWNCFDQPTKACTIIKGTEQHVLIIGDSHAWMMFPTLAKIAQENDLTLSTAASPGCPWQRNLYDATPSPEIPRRRALCMRMKKDLYERVIPALEPDIIVVMSSDYLTVRKGAEYDSDGRQIQARPAELQRLVENDTKQSLSELQRSAGKVLIIEPVPSTDVAHDPFKCLTNAKSVEECRFVANLQSTPLEYLYRGLADDTRVFDVDFDKLVCPFMPICDPVVGGQIVRFDPEHITPRFAVSLWRPVAAYLEDSRLISG